MLTSPPLAQTTTAATAAASTTAATQLTELGAPAQADAANPPATTQSQDTGYYRYNPHWWSVPKPETALQAGGALVLVLLIGFMLARMFRKLLEKYHLVSLLRWSTTALAVYLALFVLRTRRMIDGRDVITVSVHKLFLVLAILLTGFILIRIFRRVLEKYQIVRPLRWATVALAIYLGVITLHPNTTDALMMLADKALIAVMAFIGVRLLDRIVILPVMTRGGKVSVSGFVHQIVVVVISMFVIMGYASWAFHIDVTSLLAGSAVISIVLGLALQETLGNFFSGMVMQASSPFQIGDWIEVSGVEGRVVDMTWRTVTLHTNEDNYVLIPNGVVAKERIVNYHAPSRATARLVKIGLEYEIAPNDAKRVLKEAALESEGVLAEPEPQIILSDYGDSAIVYTIKFWIDHPSRHTPIENAVRVNAWYRLKQAGYGIPFQITTVELVDLHKKQQMQRAEAETARLEAIRHLPLFSQLNAEQMRQLAVDSHDVSLAAGQAIYRQNDAGDSLFVVVEGCVAVSAVTPEGKEMAVGVIEAGSHFGELSAMTGQPRPTTIRAKTDLKAIEITREHLKDLFASDPHLMQHMSAVIAQRQTERDEQLEKLGAEVPAERQTLHPHTVLEKMKGLFSVLQAKTR